MNAISQDLRYAVRTFSMNRSFAVAAVATLALGIAVNTTMFSIVNGILFRPLPYIHPKQIVALFESDQSGRLIGLSAPDFRDWKEQNRTLEQFAIYYSGRFDISVNGKPDVVLGASATPGFFQIFRTPPLRGTTFDDRAGSTAVISERLWKSAFGGQQSVIGDTITVRGAPYAIVGVMPTSFEFPNSADVWVSLDISQDRSDRSAHKYRAVARLRDSSRLKLAQTEMSAIAARLQAAYPQSNNNVTAAVIPLHEVLTRDIKTSLLLLLLLGGFVLLIAAANVASLMLVRAAYRQKEFAIRAALGASRARMTRQVFVESMILGSIGAAVGLLASLWVTRATLHTVPSELLPILPSQRPRVELVVFIFSIATSLCAALLSAIPPVIWFSRQNISATLRTSGRSDPPSQRLRPALVVAQVAASLVFLIAAGLASKSFLKLQSEDFGFNPQNVNVVDVVLPRGYNGDPLGAVRFYTNVLERLRQLPILSSVAAMDDLPLTGEGSKGGFLVGRMPTGSPSNWPTAGWHLVSDDYFHTMHIPLLRGRSFLPNGRETPSVVIINRTMAKKYWPNEDPLGQQIAIPGLDENTYASFQAGNTIWLTIVGVVGDVRHNAPGILPDAEVYVPFFQYPSGSGRLTFAVRSIAPPAVINSHIKAEVWSIESQANVQLTSYDTILQQTIQIPRFRHLVVAAFAALAMVLAAVGIYGTVGYTVAQRRHEFAVRMAVGAERWRVVSLAILAGMRLTVTGILIGIVLGIAAAHLMRSFLYGVSATDAGTFLGSALLITIVSGLTSYLAALPAMQIEPLALLQSE